MNLLFDQNIAPKLVELLADVFPDSSHVRDHELQRADDETVWAFAKEKNLAIVSKDADFHQRSFLYGFPPKIIWIRRGNCSTRDIEMILRKRKKEIEAFLKNNQSSFLALS